MKKLLKYRVSQKSTVIETHMNFVFTNTSSYYSVNVYLTSAQNENVEYTKFVRIQQPQG